MHLRRRGEKREELGKREYSGKLEILFYRCYTSLHLLVKQLSDWRQPGTSNLSKPRLIPSCPVCRQALGGTCPSRAGRCDSSPTPAVAPPVRLAWPALRFPAPVVPPASRTGP